jgi:hypothetical protein
MYVKRCQVRRGEKHYSYLRLVEAYRDEGGKVRHRILATLGREDELKASGQLEQLAGIFARLDPPLLGTRREVGSLLLVQHYLDRLKIKETVDALLPQRGRALLTQGEVVVALIANRLSAPAPLYDVAGWAGQAALPELFGIPGGLLNDDRLGRALEALSPVAEELRGRVLLAAVEDFGLDGSQLHLDLTTLRFTGVYEDSALVGKGWGSDRRVARQVRTLQATTPEGVPLYLRPHPGSCAELSALGSALERLRALTGPGLLAVADSALGHLSSLCALDGAGVRFIVPLRAQTGFAARFLSEVGPGALCPLPYVSAREAGLPQEERTRYRGALRPFPVRDPKSGATHRLQVAYIWSSEEERSVAAGRERALAKAEAALLRIRRGLGGPHYQTTEAVMRRVGAILSPGLADLLAVEVGEQGGRPTLEFSRVEAAIGEAARLDGLYALGTNLPEPLSAAEVLRLYKAQWVVEQRHRDLKGTLRVRPLFLHNDDRIAALVSLVGLALLIFGLLEADLRERLGDEELPGLLPEGRSARPTGRNILAAFQGLGLTYTPRGPELDRLTHTQRRILELLGIAPPWAEQGAGPGLRRCGKRG